MEVLLWKGSLRRHTCSGPLAAPEVIRHSCSGPLAAPEVILMLPEVVRRHWSDLCTLRLNALYYCVMQYLVVSIGWNRAAIYRVCEHGNMKVCEQGDIIECVNRVSM